MRWPFAKLHRELRVLSHDEQRWSIARADYEGGPLLVRFNEAVRELAAGWEPQQDSLEASARLAEIYLELGDKQKAAQVLGCLLLKPHPRRND